jgi:hypothetical protein
MNATFTARSTYCIKLMQARLMLDHFSVVSLERFSRQRVEK